MKIPQPPDLRGKNLLVTGGSLGLGRATALACLQGGARVVVCSRTEADLSAAVADFQAQGYDQVRAVVADVSDARQVEIALNTVAEHFGPVQGVVHAAGVLGPIGEVTQVDPQAWWGTLQVNLLGSFLVAQASCRRFQAQGGGRLVLFSGGGAASPFPYYTAYACSKVGVVRLGETLAQEMAPYGIQVNCLAPGFVATRLHQETLAAGERAGLAYLEKTRAGLAGGGVPPELGAAAAAFLVSDQAAGITGKLLAAPYDNWLEWPLHLQELQAEDIFTLRRILPRERGMDWQ